ncbi:MAG: type II secretion system protein [Pseudomonadales bacterium]|nr:type II secretion system protein [Pseudomonadales bacterium]
MKKKRITTKGFTLIELLVVISIIGVLTALLLSNFVGIRARAKDAQLKADLQQMKTALRLYYNDFQQYPESNLNTFKSCNEEACVQGSEFNSAAGGTVYMKELPAFSEYVRTNNGDGFYLGVVLENSSDQDITESATKCSAPGTADTFYVCSD